VDGKLACEATLTCAVVPRQGASAASSEAPRAEPVAAE
jgi:hypothetical protein